MMTESAANKAKREYSSEMMRDRRQRVLTGARALLAEHGLQFSIRQLSKHAGVSPQTLYDMFGGKLGIVSNVILEFEQDILREQSTRDDGSTIDDILNEFGNVVNLIMKDKKFIQTSLEMYFNLDTDETVRRTIINVPYDRMTYWLDRAQRDGNLIRGLSRRRFIQDYIEIEFLIYRRWLMGWIEDSKVVSELKANFLFFSSACMTDKARAGVLALYSEYADAAQGWR